MASGSKVKKSKIKSTTEAKKRVSKLVGAWKPSMGTPF